jgi:hypothetical protein
VRPVMRQGIAKNEYICGSRRGKCALLSILNVQNPADF